MMRLFKNPEVMKLIIVLNILVVFFIIVALALNFISLNTQKDAIIYNNSAIIGAIIDKYPDAESDVLKQIINSDKKNADIGIELLKKYGIKSKEIVLDNEIFSITFKNNLIYFLLLTALITSSIFIAIYIFMKNQYNQINSITEYIRQIEKGNYSLDIRDNDEGSMSILRNEICKITTMLKEQTEILKHDKIALSNSIADISHQLKTPITSMFVLSDLLNSEQPVEVKNKFLDGMRSQLKRIEWLVTSLLKLSKFDANTVEMKRDCIYVNKLLDSVINIMGIPLEIKMHNVKIEGKKDTKFIGDFKWSCEALINILKNCIEHTPEKGCIEIYYDENPIYTVIRITDNGTGIDKCDLPYIFNRFYKGKNASDDSVGIGLAMSNVIIEKQGGDIAVTSQVGKGSEFTIKIYK